MQWSTSLFNRLVTNPAIQTIFNMTVEIEHVNIYKQEAM